MPYVILSNCIDSMDRACMEECPVDCIYPGKRKLYIHPDECIECGACQVACPVEAITQKKKVPEAEKEFAEDNTTFFTTILQGRDAPLGNPGGWASLGEIGVDTPLVRDFTH